MSKYTRFFWLLTLAAFLITANGCSTSRWVPINEELERDGSGLHKESGQSISGYHLNDGTEIEFKGMVRLASQDSLIFWENSGFYEPGRYNPSSANYEPGSIFPLEKIGALKVNLGEGRQGVLAVVMFPVIALAVAVVVVLTTVGYG